METIIKPQSAIAIALLVKSTKNGEEKVSAFPMYSLEEVTSAMNELLSFVATGEPFNRIGHALCGQIIIGFAVDISRQPLEEGAQNEIIKGNQRSDQKGNENSKKMGGVIS